MQVDVHLSGEMRQNPCHNDVLLIYFMQRRCLVDVQQVDPAWDGASRDPDPRPRLAGAGPEVRIHGWRCANCGLSGVEPALRCGECGSARTPTTLAPLGTVWSWTVLRVGRDRGVVFAYVDLDDGPRLLVRLAEGARPAGGARVRIIGTTASGDLKAEAAP